MVATLVVVQPEIDLLGLPLKTFGLMFALGFLVSGAVIHRRMRELGHPVDWAYEMVFAALVGGLVGSRLFWLIENPDRIDGFGDVFGGTGLVWYGGVVGGAVCRARMGELARLAGRWRCSTWRPSPLATRQRDRARRLPALRRRRLRQAMGRTLGDGVPQRDGRHRPGRDRPPDADLRDARHGTDRLGAVDAARPRATGRAVRDLARARTGLERLLVEFLRRNEVIVAGLTLPQLQSVAMIVGGLIWLWLIRRRHGSVLRPAAARAPAAASA